MTKAVYNNEATTTFTDEMSDSSISSDYDGISSAMQSSSSSMDSISDDYFSTSNSGSMSESNSLELISDDYFSSLNSMKNSLSSISSSDNEFASFSDISDYQR